MRVVKQCGETWQEFGKIWQDLASLLLHVLWCFVLCRFEYRILEIRSVGACQGPPRPHGCHDLRGGLC